MKFVVLIFGASGSGKSTLMAELAMAGRQHSVHIKATDRAPRNYDGMEIRCVPAVTGADYDYIYQTYGYRYGIDRKQIDSALQLGQHHFIICNDIKVIRSIKNDYGNLVKVIFHHFDAPRQALLEIQQGRNISDDEIELRLAKTEALYKTFVSERKLFDGVIHNRYGQSPQQLVGEIEELLDSLQEPVELNHFSRETLLKIDRIVAQLERERPAEIQAPHEPGYVFIVMPMKKGINSLPDVHAAIQRACKATRMRAGRVDDAVYVGSITERVLADIRLAEFVVADLTHERPNVYFEVGYALALGKPVVLLAGHETEVHFDLYAHNTIRYSNHTELESELTKHLRQLKKQTRSRNDRKAPATAKSPKPVAPKRDD